MKVLFAVSNENISESVVKKYQKDYKEIISYKNVYYFNAILKEIQRDKTYDRIVISEDLEPFANNDYEAIDRFIFDKLDSISDEATDQEGGDTPIILICSDRRAKGEQLLVKLFSIGVYSAILGQDRSISEVCKLIKKPRTKKEAKIYYKIESDDAQYQEESEDTVSEIEIQNIRAHYKKLGRNEDAYVESFDNIAGQYTDAQLKVIVKFLPLNVKAVLETRSPKYQSIMAFSGETARKPIKKDEKKEEAIKIDFIENQLNKPKMTKPVIVPSAVNTNKVTKLNKKENSNIGLIQEDMENDEDDLLVQRRTNYGQLQKKSLEIETEQETQIEQPKRGRGRPRKVVTEDEVVSPKRGRGRPKKVVDDQVTETKNTQRNTVNLFDLDKEENEEPMVLPGLDIEESNIQEKIDTFLPGLEEDNNEVQNEINNYNNAYTTENDYSSYNNQTSNEIVNQENTYQNVNIENLLTKDKKIVSFVGTTKNGTSFLVNNLGELFSSMGIKTAILDATQNKNSYYIYTKNEEELRNTALNCMNNLANDIAEGINVNKNLTVYTALPTERENNNYQKILSTLVKNYSLVLIDCDFNTNMAYFNSAQEIYLVQSMDILTIQPLTAFLRELKAKNILSQEKIKIVVNKQAKIRSLNTKIIVGGMAYYNDPSMSFMTELFNKDNVRSCAIPFDEQVYTKYLEGLVNCKISLKGYPKNFMVALKELGNTVYPLLNNKYRPVDNYDKK